MNAVERLIVERATQTMTADGFESSLSILADNAKRSEHFAKAREWVAYAIRIVKESPGGDEFPNNEAIAQEILDGIAKSRRGTEGLNQCRTTDLETSPR